MSKQDKRTKLSEPWLYTYKEFTDGLLYYATSRPWTRPAKRVGDADDLLAFDTPNQALAQLDEWRNTFSFSYIEGYDNEPVAPPDRHSAYWAIAQSLGATPDNPITYGEVNSHLAAHDYTPDDSKLIYARFFVDEVSDKLTLMPKDHQNTATLVLIAPPDDFKVSSAFSLAKRDADAIREFDPRRGHEVTRLPMSTLQQLDRDNRVKTIPALKHEQDELKALFPKSASLQKWHFSEVIKAFISTDYLPPEIMQAYRDPLIRWASIQKQKHGDNHLRLPHPFSARAKTRSRRMTERREDKQNHEQVPLGIYDLRGLYDVKTKTILIPEGSEMKEQLTRIANANKTVSLNLKVVNGDYEPIPAPAVIDAWEREMERERERKRQHQAYMELHQPKGDTPP